MTQRLLIPIFLLLSLVLAGQKTTLQGRVTNNKKQGMPGASISIKDSYDGATSDSAGYFKFITTDTGSQLITISSTGYKLFEQTVRLSGETIEIAAILKESMNELQAVMISAGSFEAGDEKKVTVLKTMDIVTTASANADIASAMKTLPGTQQIGESAELFVRGGAGYETKQFFDGTAIANPNFTQAPDLASRGRFSPFLFKGTVFSTGGYSALYGQALSSALILESIDLPERSEASASFSPIFVGGQYQYLDKKKKYSWGGSAGYSNIGPYFKLIKQKNDFFKAPVSWNGDANFRIKTSKTGMVKFYTRYDGNKMGVRSPDIDSAGLYDAFNLNNNLWYTNVSYKERLANRWKMNLGMSLNLNDDNNSQQVQQLNYTSVTQGLPPYISNKNFSLINKNLLAQAKLVLEHKLSGLSALRFGGEYWYSKDRFRFNQFSRVLEDHFKAAFIESDIYVSNSIAARLGARLEHSNLLKRTNLAPRASVAYKFNKTAQVSVDYGLFYQKPINQYLMETDNLRYMKATHAIITYQYMDALRTFRAQAFHKKYQQLVSTYPQNSSNGSGYAQGVEFFWRDKKTLNQFDYWVTYSFLDTRRQYLNFPYSMAPNFAAKHTANLVIKRFFTDLNMQVNANYQFASGRPYYRIGIDNNNQKTEITDEGTTADYHNLSISLNYLTSIAKSFAVIVFSVNNLTGSKQVFGYNYSYNGLNKTEINPAAPRFLFLGLFLSWGTDRRQDAINNNL